MDEQTPDRNISVEEFFGMWNVLPDTPAEESEPFPRFSPQSEEIFGLAIGQRMGTRL